MKILIAVGFLALIGWNLATALYYMVTDRGGSGRMVRALTRRIALSIALIALVCVGIATGIVAPHGVHG